MIDSVARDEPAHRLYERDDAHLRIFYLQPASEGDTNGEEDILGAIPKVAADPEDEGPIGREALRVSDHAIFRLY